MQRKLRRVSVQLDPVQMVWLHSQHLFQKIEQNSQNEIKFYKSNSGVQIRAQGESGQGVVEEAREELLRVIGGNEVRFINTSLHKDLYIRISKAARKQFPKSYIIFLHYETFENCCRKLQQKFNITSIAPELERLRKLNSHFCFLIAERHKIDDIEKFTHRILHSEVSCASTTFSHRREQPHLPYKRTLSVSSLRGSFSEHNEEPCRLSTHPNPVEEQLFQMSESIITKLSHQQMEEVKRRGLFEGTRVSIEHFEGTYLAMTKKLYYANRLQLTPNPYMQPIYAYAMVERSPYRWTLSLITDRHYRSLEQLETSIELASPGAKVTLLIRVGRALLALHSNLETYSGLKLSTVLLDCEFNVALSAAIQKEIPPHTNAFLYDVRIYLLLIYRLFMGMELGYDALVFKQEQEEYFCTLSHRSSNPIMKEFLHHADKLFIGEYDLATFLAEADNIKIL